MGPQKPFKMPILDKKQHFLKGSVSGKAWQEFDPSGKIINISSRNVYTTMAGAFCIHQTAVSFKLSVCTLVDFTN